MTPELSYLVYAIFLGLVHLLATGGIVMLHHGMAYAASPRDEQKPLPAPSARILRAFQNFLQSFAFFLGAVLVAHLLGVHSAWTVHGAQCYFWARLIYIPIYALGIPYLRGLVWGVSYAGICMILFSVLGAAPSM